MEKEKKALTPATRTSTLSPSRKNTLAPTKKSTPMSITFRNAGNALREIGSSVNGQLNTIKYGLTNYTEKNKLGKRLQSTWQKLGEFSKKGLTSIKNGLTSIGNGLVSLTDKIAPISVEFKPLKEDSGKIAKSIKGYNTFLEKELSSGKSWFKETSITSAEKGKLSAIADKTVEIIESIQEKSLAFFKNTGKKIKELSSNVAVKLKEFKESASEKWKSYFPKIKTAFRDAKAKIVAGTAVVVGAVKSGLDRFRRDLKEISEGAEEEFHLTKSNLEDRNNFNSVFDEENGLVVREGSNALIPLSPESTKLVPLEQGKQTKANENMEEDEFVFYPNGEYQEPEKKKEGFVLHEIQEDTPKKSHKKAPKAKMPHVRTKFVDDLYEQAKADDLLSYWEFIKFQMNRAKYHISLDKSFDVENFTNTMDKIIYTTKNFINKNADEFETFEECLAYIPVKYPQLKEDVLVAFDALDKLSSDLKIGESPLSQADRENIAEFLKTINVENIKYGFDLDDLDVTAIKEEPKVEEDKSLEDVGITLAPDENNILLDDLLAPTEEPTIEQLPYIEDINNKDNEPKVEQLPYIEDIKRPKSPELLFYIEVVQKICVTTVSVEEQRQFVALAGELSNNTQTYKYA